MYARDEVKKTKQAFWTAYGQYMRVVPFADAERQSWVNYKTGIKHIYFRMEADNQSAQIAIEIDHPDAGIRALIFDQFVQYKNMLQEALGESWEWLPVSTDAYGKESAEIKCVLTDVSIMRKDDWPKLISFFKPRMIALDEFWSSAKYAFEVFI
ncbi:DUF4268 domain-containing protein [Sphingobacterium corticis]|uniref:DUF4268 domain-containing protein n=1 Tax=Sphingobacterium corticis TaxID=1812823 RepID=A0ABW5NJX3_9SPHI